MKRLLKVLAAIFISYAVIFSIAFTIVLYIAASAVYSPFMEVKRLKTENPQQTLFMKQQLARLQENDRSIALKQIFIPLDSISPSLVKAVLAAEDDGFYLHPGFDITAILQAIEHNRSRNSFRRGASTITQQVAKNLFSGGKKSYERKYRELFYAVLMEFVLGKDRILELYMNYAQWGLDIFGCEAAAQYFFGKSSSHLTLPECARLAAILAKPATLNPHSTKSVLLQKRLSVIANNLFRRKSIDTTMWSELGGDDSTLLRRDSAPKNWQDTAAGMTGAGEPGPR
jgi:monofunctional biosynthetic peptidoglycan transglycosylase